MMAPKPPHEAARLTALREYEILDTDPEIGFDDLTLLAASICEVPISVITMIDAERQWFKSRVGMEATETPLEFSFCAYAILQRDMLVVEDAYQDATFATHPAVTEENGIRFYAGAPLVTPEGYALGTICVADRVPRQLKPEQYKALEALSRQVLTQLELRRKLRDLRRATIERDRAEAEKAAKSAEIERDLQFAHQFQQALLPDAAHYPAVPNAPFAALRLNFHHIYQPTLSLGGDFFDVLKLSEHRAGVFIADVMGHGARSALVTAILRTLFQELATQTPDPGQLLTLMNGRFHHIMEDSHQFLFVSAAYLVVDTERAVATYASAGHPAPVWVDRITRQVTPWAENLDPGPALGLVSDAVYNSYEVAVKAGDMFLMFTDGLVEAPNAAGDEFGETRLHATIAQHLDSNTSQLMQAIMDDVNDFTGTTSLPDDLCLVAVEAICDSPIT
ncbi:MAG: SpoIIE family protein phosphatase [Abitibacteriaceae bacterium]|nr:SpoIIE family protein phosphatase [Abditibacteriaceae bacterium]